MNNIAIYIVKIILASGMFTLFYHFFLSSLKSFKCNRFYLISVIIFSLIIPFIQFHSWKEKPVIAKAINYNFDNLTSIYKRAPKEFQNQTIEFNENRVIQKGKSPHIKEYPKTSHTSNWTKTDIIYWAYYIVSSLFLLYFIASLFSMFRLIWKNTKVKNGSFSFVYLNNLTLPFTFFHYIFIPKTSTLQDNSWEQIITHEKQHAKELHSIDLIIAKFILCFVWFNPFFYWLLKFIRENHEYLADKAVLKNKTDFTEYQHIVLNIQEKLQSQKLTLVNNFNFLTIKKRLTMMNRKNQPIRNAVFAILGISLLLVSVIVFAQAKNGEKVIHNMFQSDEEKNQNMSDNNGISQEQFNYYISEMKKANFKFDPKNRKRDLTKELQNNPNGDSLKSLYHQMSWPQKKLTQTKYHFFLIPASESDSLTTADWESYKTLAKKLYEENRKKGADSARTGGMTFVLNPKIKPQVVCRGIWIMDDNLYQKYGYLNVMYRNMSRYQKANTPHFIEIMHRYDKPKPNSPTAAQLAKWSKNPTLWGVWLNGKRLSNIKLANYKPADIYYYTASSLTPIAQKNDGFKAQLELYTKAGYETAYGDPKTWKN